MDKIVLHLAHVEYSRLNSETAKQILGSPERLEVRIKTNGSLSEPVLTNEDISEFSYPPYNLPDNYGIGIKFTDTGRKNFRVREYRVEQQLIPGIIWSM
ncbi:MAG: hypothetical protein LUQ07_04915 [Methanospirillum sp.]|nr:hypothetical protein [Methanospirillum sp.]